MGSPLALDNAVGLCPGDHASWAYEDLPGLRAACAIYLGDGPPRGERLVYVGDRQHGHLVDDLAGLVNRDAMLDSGQLEVHTVDELYRSDGQFRAHVQVEAFRRRAEQSVDDGYTGLRILGDITELIVDESLTQQLIEYEVAVDAMFACCPALALCAFDRERVGSKWRLVTALHRVQHLERHQPAFAVTVSAGVVHLVGEVDTSSAGDLARLLDAIGDSTQGELTLDLGDLEFIDIAATRVLALLQRRLGARGRHLHFAGVGPSAVNTLRAFALNGDMAP